MTYKKKFSKLSSFKSFVNKLHPNRVAETKEEVNEDGSKVFTVKYYINTKALRNKFDFPDTSIF